MEKIIKLLDEQSSLVKLTKDTASAIELVSHSIKLLKIMQENNQTKKHIKLQEQNILYACELLIKFFK